MRSVRATNSLRRRSILLVSTASIFYYVSTRREFLRNNSVQDFRTVQHDKYCTQTLLRPRWTHAFDYIAESAFDRSQLQPHRERETNYTWERGNGGLDDSDRDLLANLYGSVESVFEYGLGESTRLAAAAKLVRYSGVDSDAQYVANSRNSAPSHFKFYFADIGPTREWGNPKELLRKQSIQYQIAPLLSELRPFDVYFVDGRFRVACVCASILHASKFGGFESVVLMHDYKARPQYHVVETIADVIERSQSGKTVLLRRSKNISDERIISVWNSFYNITA